MIYPLGLKAQSSLVLDIDWCLTLLTMTNFIHLPAVRFKWHSYCFLLRDCHVSLYLAQCNRKLKSYNQVSQLFQKFNIAYMYVCINTQSMDKQVTCLFISHVLFSQLQAYFCNIIICFGDFHLPVCWYGCLGH